MDITVVIILFVIAFLLVGFRRRFSPAYIGAKGESKVARQLSRLDNDQYKVINDVLISTEKASSQIDHVVVSIYGIFVIETKNYKGWIHGHEKSEYWKQTIYKYKSEFRNPIKQNWAHIYALKYILSDFGQVKYHPIIVFAGTAELKNIYSTIPVIYDSQLFQTIFEKSITNNLDIEQVNRIANRLTSFCAQTKESKNDHINFAHETAYDRKQKAASHICPRCNGTLVIREGRYGRFYGCSNYPNCKYTEK